MNAINNSITSIVVGSVSGFPVSTPYTLVIDEGTPTQELVTVTSAAGTTLTITRGSDGTAQASHAAGAEVKHVASAQDFREPQDHMASPSGVHGVTGLLVGTTDAQNLSNKTLVTPAITGTLIMPDQNADIELGAQGVANAPLIDFHSGAAGTDYDSRIIATGGTGANEGGTLSLLAGSIYLSAPVTLPQDNLYLAAANAAIELGAGNSANTPAIDFHSSNNPGNSYDSRIIASGGLGSDGQGALTLLAAGGINLNGPVNLSDTSGAVVTKTAAQTLTNKTLTSPTINSPTVSSPTINGTIGGSAVFSGSGGVSTTGSVLCDTAGGEITLGYAGSGGLAIAQGNVATHVNGIVLWVSGNSLVARKSNGTDVVIVA